MLTTSRICRVTLRFVIGAALVFGSGTAFSAVLLQLQRLSDTDVLLIGSGFLDGTIPAENQHSLYLIDPFLIRPSPRANHPILDESELYAGSYRFNFANDAGSGIGDSFTNTIYIGRDVGTLPFPQIPLNEPLVGSMLLHLANGESFAPIGSTGAVYWGTTTGNIRGILSGSWEMVAPDPVPLPSSISMMLGGIFVLAMLYLRSTGRTIALARACVPH